MFLSVRKGNILYCILLERQSWTDIQSKSEGPRMLTELFNLSTATLLNETYDAMFYGESGNQMCSMKARNIRGHAHDHKKRTFSLIYHLPIKTTVVDLPRG